MQMYDVSSKPYHQRLRCGSLALVALTLAFVSAAHAQRATTFEEAISPDYSYAEAVQQTSDWICGRGHLLHPTLRRIGREARLER
jgi:hypothetical protein